MQGIIYNNMRVFSDALELEGENQVAVQVQGVASLS